MKAFRLFYACAASALLSSCTAQLIDDGDGQHTGCTADSVTNVRLHCATLDVSTRAALTANGKSMTDLFVLDYDQGTGQLLQVLHQTSDSEDFGAPVLTMGYGTHTVKVLATRSEVSALVDINGDNWITTPGTAQPVEVGDVPSGWSSNKTSDTFFAAKSIQGVPREFREKYFTPVGPSYRIDDGIKARVDFKTHDLLKDSYPTGCHLIVCRNVLIYFTEEAKNAIFRKFRNSLAQGACLFIGSTEQILEYKEMGYDRTHSFFYYRIP